MTTAYVFPGQGSQVRGMGGDLFTRYTQFVATADEALGYSVAELCLNDTDNKLRQTQYTQPALYVVNALSYFAATEDAARLPDYVAGHSLGEYNALLAARAFDFKTGLQLVKRRGELMAEAGNGAMAAIIGITADDVSGIIRTHALNNIWIANYNAPTQTVVSGTAEGLAASEQYFSDAGAAYKLLPVSGAFHSPLMQPAQQTFNDFIAAHRFGEPQLPVIANINAAPYQAGAIHDSLVKQIVRPVRWTASVNYLLVQGVTKFIEIGPGAVLTSLIEKTKRTRMSQSAH